MHEANLTRFGPETFELVQGVPVTRSSNFRALQGPAKLVLRTEGVDRAWIKINGENVAEQGSFAASGETVIDLQLKKDNAIEITVPGFPAGTLSVRVTQEAKADLGLLRQGYFGLNTTSMERQRAFYDTLGFKGEIYPAGPETSETFAQSLGFPENYLIHVALTSLEDPPVAPFVDTVQFRENSYRSEPPYAQLNHLGMAYGTFSTANLDGDFAYLKGEGVEFLSAPAKAPNGERFVFLKDQDGAFLKLIETTDGDKAASGPSLQRMVNTNMNVSDMERSREFYRLIGFSESEPCSLSGGGDFAAAHGFDHAIEFEGEDISLGEGTDGATIQLRQWKNPFDGAPPYAPPVNHLGIDRINFYVKDLTATIKAMNELGFEQMAPIGGSAEIGIVFFFDPDGIKVQFAGPQQTG